MGNPHLTAYLREQPWALRRETLDAWMALTADQIKAPEAAAGRRTSGGVVAVIPVYGPISQRPDLLTYLFGGSTVQGIQGAFRQAMADPAVQAVVFDYDSPGGGIYGIPELADEIRAARGRKPIEAVADSLMASAAYWLASATDRISVTPSGEAGSIGVNAAHVDLSGAMEKAGEKWTLLSYGENKTAGNPYEPLSAEAAAILQARVDEYGRMFERSVAKGRGVSVEVVRATYGQGLVFGAKEAVTRGLADEVATLDDVLSRLSRRQPVMQSAAAEETAPEVVAEWEVAAAKIRTNVRA